MSHVYSDTFFDYIDEGALRSARAVIDIARPLLNPGSVLDLGCGRGAWLKAWSEAGIPDVIGVDGYYVDRSQLMIPDDSFVAVDLTTPVRFDRRFDLAQSLEVGEHLPASAARQLVESLTDASDRVLFSAAVPGQGGEFHVNEQPLSYWQDLFAARGYQAFDCIRPKLAGVPGVAPWYRYNTILYVNAAGQAGLPDAVRETRVPDGAPVGEAGSFAWRMRLGIVSVLPRSTVTWIAQTRAAALARQARKQG